MKWPEKKLGDICKFAYGDSLPKQNRIDGKINVYGSNGIVGNHNQFITLNETIIVGRKGSAGQINWSEKSCYPIDTTYFIDKNFTDQNLRWLYWYLKQLRLNELNKAAAVPGLNRDDAYRIKILLPPLAEQQRIAALLDTADRILKQRESALAKLDQLAHSMFVECCKKNVLQSYLLGDIAYFYAGNSLPEGIEYVSQDGGYFLMKVSDMNLDGNEKYIYKCKEWTSVKGSNSGTCPSGSIVIPKRGGAIGTNKKRITTRSTVLDPNLMAIKANENFITQNFLMQWFLKFDLASIANGSSVPQLNKKDLTPLKILVPQLSVQKELDQIAKTIEKNRDEMIRCKAYVENLLHSLQHQSFAVN